MNLSISKKWIITLYLLLIIVTTIRFALKSKNNFPQLNYNFSDKTILKKYGKITIDSVNYNYLSINYKSNTFNNQQTYMLLSKGNKYYFRYVYLINDSNKSVFKGVEWLVGSPKKGSNYNLFKIDLPLYKEEGKNIITIGDEFIYKNEAKYFRSNIDKHLKINFRGRYKDSFGYPYDQNVKNLNNEELVLFFYGNVNYTLDEFDKLVYENVKLIGKSKKIIWINYPYSKDSLRNKKSIAYNKLINTHITKENIVLIDAYSLIQNNFEKYLISNIHLNKSAYIDLSNEVIKQIND